MKKKAVSRRAALTSLGGSAAAVTLLPWLSDEGVRAYAGIQRAAVTPAPMVLSAAQFAALEALVEAIIPADERSPGAREARVADYIDLLLDESDASLRQQWFDSLAALDRVAIARYGAPVVELSVPRLDQLLTEVSRNELMPQTAVERFFVMTKQATISGDYTSEIGIHQDLRYQGNKMLAEFHGCLAEEGRDCPHCGQKPSPSSRSGAPR